jgi:hypothetical protein
MLASALLRRLRGAQRRYMRRGSVGQSGDNEKRYREPVRGWPFLVWVEGRPVVTATTLGRESEAESR